MVDSAAELVVGTRPHRSLAAILGTAVGAFALLAGTVPFYGWVVAHETSLLAAVLLVVGGGAVAATRMGCNLVAALGVVLLPATAISLRTVGGVAPMTPLPVVLWYAVEDVLTVSVLVGFAAFVAGRRLRGDTPI